MPFADQKADNSGRAIPSVQTWRDSGHRQDRIRAQVFDLAAVLAIECANPLTANHYVVGFHPSWRTGSDRGQ